MYLLFISNPPPLVHAGDLSIAAQTQAIKKHNLLGSFFPFTERSVLDFSLFTVSLICLQHLVLVQSVCCVVWSEECKFVVYVRVLLKNLFFQLLILK